MDILQLIPNTPEWLESRLKYKCASEAPAMMGESKYMTRNQLLDLKKGWESNPNSGFKDAFFDKCHEHEDNAREILELQECESYPPMVGLLDDQYLASFDGLLDQDGRYGLWEHKTFNKTLAENVLNNILEPFYFWQLEHQMLVADASEVLFTCSDGTIDNRVSMIYKSDPDRRRQLIEGWGQFDVDLANHKLKAKVEVVTASKEVACIPVLDFVVDGMEVSSNADRVLKDIKLLDEIERCRVLDSDYDFLNRDKLNKEIKSSRVKLIKVVDSVTDRFSSYRDFVKTVKDIDACLSALQKDGEKQVKWFKSNKKAKIINLGVRGVLSYVADVECNIRSETGVCVDLHDYVDSNLRPDFDAAIKHKRSIASVEDAVDQVVADFKISIDNMEGKVLRNIAFFNDGFSDFDFLFGDFNDLVTRDEESFIAVIKCRVNDYVGSTKQSSKSKGGNKTYKITATYYVNADDEREAIDNFNSGNGGDVGDFECVEIDDNNE